MEFKRLLQQLVARPSLLPLVVLVGCREPRTQVLRWPLPQHIAGCQPERDTTSTPFAMLRPGRYELTLVATVGTEAGRRARGRLWLTTTSAADRSPRTGQRVPKSDTLESPLYGATDVALASVGAPMTGDTIAPRPESTDPIYPGVRVLVATWQTDRPKQNVLLVGTLSNLRNGQMWLDGGGIGLFVTANRGDTIAGRWGPWGIMANGSGYFCATPIQ